MHAKKYNEMIELSIQEILDCSKKNMHCVGGQPSSVADYIMKYGIAYESNYIYEAKKNTCRAKYHMNKTKSRTGERLLEMLLSEDLKDQKINPERKLQSSNYHYPKYTTKFDNIKKKFYYQVDYANGTTKYLTMYYHPFTPSFKEIKSHHNQSNLSNKILGSNQRYEKLQGYYYLKESVLDVINALQYGPVVTAHYAPKSFKYYSRGVYDTLDCIGKTKMDVNHSTLIVGYNLNAKIPYFEMRNSWGDDWGDAGYFKMKMGEFSENNKGLCLIAGTPFMIMPYLFQ